MEMSDTTTLILIVDDRHQSPEEQIFRQGGFGTERVLNGAGLKERLKNHLPDLLLLRAPLLDLDAAVLCQEIKSDSRTADIPVIFITDSHSPEKRVVAFRSGAADYLPTPFCADELLARVKIHVDHLRQRRLLIEKNHELERTQNQLAAMAQMATGVLHNVGNVINSLNISADLAAGHVQNLQLSALSKLADMLSSHSEVRGDAAWDEKFRKIPGYLRILSETYDSRREAGLKELAALREKMAHVKSIIATQQGYARGAISPEPVKVSRLVDDAIELNAGYLSENLTVEREFLCDPEITVEKHRAVLILVNLLRNARQSCERAGRTDKRIIIRLASPEPGKAAVQVIDNGAGIKDEDVAKLFDFGFTTKKDGHGFGLHSSRKTAEELGGTLELTGNETGVGATFTLTLPHFPRVPEPAYEI